MLPLGVFTTMLELLERFAALLAGVRPGGLVRAHVALVVALPHEFLAALTAVELEAAFVGGHVRAQSPFGFESL